MTAITSVKFADDPSPPVVDFASWHALAERIYASGIIDGLVESSRRGLLDALSKLPPSTQQLWTEVIRRRSGQSRLIVPVCLHSTDLEVRLESTDEVGCEECGAVILGIPQAAIHSSFTAYTLNKDRGLRPGDSCADSLAAVFEKVAPYAERAVIIDPYVATDALRAEQRDDGSSGLRKFIELCGRAAVPSIEIITSQKGALNGSILTSTDLVLEMANLAARISSGDTAIVLSVVRQGRAGRAFHDRWVGFSWSQVGQMSWSLGKGLAQFDGSKARGISAVARVADDLAVTARAQLVPELEISALIKRGA